MVKTILFELNEVPWKVMDWFCEQNPRSAFAQVRAEGRGYETIAEDSGELHPWVTWPSLHRGVNNDRHGIQASRAGSTRCRHWLSSDLGAFWLTPASR